MASSGKAANNLFLNVARGGREKTAKYRAWEKQTDALNHSGIVKLQGEVVANLEKAQDDTLIRWERRTMIAR